MLQNGRRKGLLNVVVDLLFDEGARFCLHEIVLAFRAEVWLALSIHAGEAWSEGEGELQDAI